MAEEQLSPISAPKPPAVNPLGAARTSTLKLKPVIRKPGAPGAARPTLSALKRPTLGAAKPAAPAAAAVAPAGATSASLPAAAPAGAPADAVSQLKSITQKLKGVTQQIPQQAILHKTGIIADQNLTEAQKQASKSRTARISLSDAIGVAPVANEAAPMKTIRIKRPVDLPGAAPKAPSPSRPDGAGESPAPAASAAPTAAPAPAPAPTVTQRKTLKISRPGAVRPGGPKLGLKKPGAAPAAPAAATDATPPADEVADIPDLPTTATVAAPPPAPAPSASEVAGVPAGLLVFDFILQFAACVAMGFLGWHLYDALNTAWF